MPRTPRKMRAALYLRSSKDRSDVSIDAQRHALRELAAARDMLIVQEFADAVESGKDEDRPAFMQLVAAVRKPDRGWDTLLVLDTARIARRTLIALLFEERECAKHGVTIVYKSLPDADPVMMSFIKQIMQASDQLHSMTSRVKGLAGMAENVRQGWRGAGNAPRGYKLEFVPTGAVRDGEPVTKSRLVVSEEASRVADYLRRRAQGAGRKPLGEALGIPLTSLIGMERNALTYAGHTTFNVRADGKWRPRSEWMIQRNTHQALITDEEAEVLLRGLEERKHQRRTSGEYLLTGLLVTPAGEPWYGNGTGHYRHRGSGSHVRAANIERLVLERLGEDLLSDRFIDQLVEQARQAALAAEASDPTELRAKLTAVTRRIARQLELAEGLADPAPVLRRIDELERQRRAIEDRVQDAEHELAVRRTLGRVNPATVRRVMEGMVLGLKEGSRDEVKDALTRVVERVVFDPGSREASIHYAVAAARLGSGRGVGTSSLPRGSATLFLRTNPSEPATLPRWQRKRSGGRS